jgi:beta-lactamase regulating signal transducer with metallopeptidase domain
MDALVPLQQVLAAALASALLHALWQDALLALTAALTLAAMARASAARRHGVALAFLAAMLLVPAVQFLRFWQQSGATIHGGWLPAMPAPGFGVPGNVFEQDSSPLAPVVVLLWLAGAALMLLRHAGGLRVVAALERSPCRPLPPAWQQRLDELRGALGITRTVAVRLSEDVLAPCAARVLRPVIWVPLSLLTRTPADQLEALLAHELAHIARKDWLWNGVQCVIESLLFFHPAAWWLGRRIRQEREQACDDLAVAACGDPLALAEALAALERERQPCPRLALAARGGPLLKRIRRLLSGAPSGGRWGAPAVLGALIVTALLLVSQLGLAGCRLPDLVVRATTAGELGPGDQREIIANGPDKLRHYRASVDEQGRLTEVYAEDGRVCAIDAAVRQWITGLSRPIVLPPPPALPDIEALSDCTALFEQLALHPDVVARLGTPAVMASTQVDGNVHLAGADGDADIRTEWRGPRGTATVSVEAELHSHVWTLRTVDVR